MKKIGFLLFFVATVLFLAAEAAAQPICSPSNWCWENPLPQGNTINGIWNDGEEIYTVGQGGMILHYDGHVWTRTDSPATPTLNAIWGTSGSHIFAVGREGTILHFDGSIWEMQASGTSAHLSSLWGSAGNDIWAVGDGVILHNDGVNWTTITSSPELNQQLTAVWGSGPQDVFVVGDEGTILHYDGVNWSEMTSSVSLPLMAIWGAGPNEVFAAGGTIYPDNEGTILFYDGITWTAMDLETENRIGAIWGTGYDDVFAAGYKRGMFVGLVSYTMYHFDGVSWSIWSETPHAIDCLTGDAPNRAFAAGVAGTVMKYDGESWSRLSTGPLDDFRAVWGSSSTDVYVGGDYVEGGGGTLHHFDGSGWSQVGNHAQDIKGIWGTGSDDVYVGFENVVVHFDGADWTQIFSPPDAITAIWGIGGDLFVGTLDPGYGANVYRYDGSTWTTYSDICNTKIYTHGIAAIYGFGPDDVYAVCRCGGFPSVGDTELLHFNGDSWSSVEWFDDHCPGGLWGTSGTDLYIVGGAGIGHYDGNSLTFTDLDPSMEYAHIRDLWAVSSTDIYAVAEFAHSAGPTENILHYDGSSWSPVEANAYSGVGFNQSGLQSIWGDGQGHIFAVGEDGAILHGHIVPANVNDQPELERFSVRCYPNPFNPRTIVEYNLPQPGHLTVKVYSVRGELVRILVDETTTAGPGRVEWNGADDHGLGVAAGVYIFELTAPGVREERKVALLK